MAKKILELTEDDIKEGIIKKVLVGKSQSQLIIKNYDTSTIEGLNKGLERSEKCANHFSTMLVELREFHIFVINDFLSHTHLKIFDQKYNNYNLNLSDCFCVEDDSLIHFVLDFQKHPDESKKTLLNEPLWKVNAMKSYNDGSNVSDLYVMDKQLLNSCVMEHLFKLEHDSFPSLAAQMLWDLSLIKNSQQDIGRRIEAAFYLGVNNTHFNNYARTSHKQSARAQLTRNEILKDIYNRLRPRKARGEKPEDLWSEFIGYLDNNADHFDQLKEETPNIHNKSTWYLTYFDANGNQRKIKYTTFQRELRNPVS